MGWATPPTLTIAMLMGSLEFFFFINLLCMTAGFVDDK
jgi:hypothetical protein